MHHDCRLPYPFINASTLPLLFHVHSPMNPKVRYTSHRLNSFLLSLGPKNVAGSDPMQMPTPISPPRHRFTRLLLTELQLSYLSIGFWFSCLCMHSCKLVRAFVHSIYTRCNSSKVNLSFIVLVRRQPSKLRIRMKRITMLYSCLGTHMYLPVLLCNEIRLYGVYVRTTSVPTKHPLRMLPWKQLHHTLQLRIRPHMWK